MSLYSFLYGINPDYKKILANIKVMGTNLNIEAPNFIQIERFRDVWYVDGIVSVLARIGGGLKYRHLNNYKKIEKSEFYHKTIDYKPKDNYVLFQFKKNIDVKNYSLQDIIFEKGYEKNHQNKEQETLLQNIFSKAYEQKKLTDYELKCIPYNIDFMFTEYKKVGMFIDRENILEVIKATNTIRKNIKGI